MTMDVAMADDELEGASWMGGRPGVGVSSVLHEGTSECPAKLTALPLNRCTRLPRSLTSSLRESASTILG